MIGAIRLAAVLAIVAASVAQAAPQCAEIAERAGRRAGVPSGLMSAIALVETGRNGNSWPWTLNEGGKGMHFDHKDEALTYLRDAIARGVTNIDIGCMQLNWRWHSAGFKSAADILDPDQNATYAALFLIELKKRLGSWEAATAHYHSADPTRGDAYLQKVAAAGADLDRAPRVAQRVDGQQVGLLLTGGSPLFEISASGLTMNDIVKAAAEAAAKETVNGQQSRQDSRPDSMVLNAPEDVSPRLRRRWDAVERARAALLR